MISDAERELEVQTRIADARCLLIEELQPFIAILCGAFAHLIFHQWIISAVFGLSDVFRSANSVCQAIRTGMGRLHEIHSHREILPAYSRR